MSNIISVNKIPTKGWILLMYIRQECLFSFEEILKFQKENKLQLILSQLDFSNLINKLTKPKHKRGPKGYNPVSLINALIAMQVEKSIILKD